MEKRKLVKIKFVDDTEEDFILLSNMEHAYLVHRVDRPVFLLLAKTFVRTVTELKQKRK